MGNRNHKPEPTPIRHYDNNPKSSPTFRILIIGDAGVGKTSLLLRYVDNVFFLEGKLNVGCDYRTKHVISDTSTHCTLNIWDTAGQERFRSIGSSYYRGTSGILVVFDVNDRASFDQLKVMQEGKWLRSIRCYCPGNEQIILVGNKIDTPGTRVVSYEEAMSFAKSLKIPFLETSAKENLGVEEVFRMLVQLMLRGEVMEFRDSTR